MFPADFEFIALLLPAWHVQWTGSTISMSRLFWQFCMRKSASEPEVVFLWTCGKFDPVKKENRQKLKKKSDLSLTCTWFYCCFCCCFFFSILHILHVLLVSKTGALIVSSSWSDVLTRVGHLVIIWIFQEGQPPSGCQTSGNSLFVALWTSSAWSSQVSNSECSYVIQQSAHICLLK